MTSCTVRVWRVRLSDSAPCDCTFLSAEERARADRFVFARDRNRFVAARSALRRALANMLSIAPEQVRFRYGSHGKPALAYPLDGPEFNLSHSENRALVAVGGAHPIGVDLEACKPFAEMDDVAATVFTPKEFSHYASGGNVETRATTFFRFWARKEAVLKALGTGLSLPANRIDQAGGTLTVNGQDRTAEWSLIDFDAFDGFAAALAVMHPDVAVPLTLMDFD